MFTIISSGFAIKLLSLHKPHLPTHTFMFLNSFDLTPQTFSPAFFSLLCLWGPVHAIATPGTQSCFFLLAYWDVIVFPYIELKVILVYFILIKSHIFCGAIFPLNIDNMTCKLLLKLLFSAIFMRYCFSHFLINTGKMVKLLKQDKCWNVLNKIVSVCHAFTRKCCVFIYLR